MKRKCTGLRGGTYGTSNDTKSGDCPQHLAQTTARETGRVTNLVVVFCNHSTTEMDNKHVVHATIER